MTAPAARGPGRSPRRRRLRTDARQVQPRSLPRLFSARRRSGVGSNRLQRTALTAGAVEIFWREPLFKRRFACRPFRVEERIPGGVAAAALVDRGLAKDAFECKAVP